jgi:hypothetical protein
LRVQSPDLKYPRLNLIIAAELGNKIRESQMSNRLTASLYKRDGY